MALLAPRQNMAIPFLATVKHAEDERLFVGIINEIGDDTRMPKKANPKAWQDIVSGRCEMGLVGNRHQGLIRMIRPSRRRPRLRSRQ